MSKLFLIVGPSGVGKDAIYTQVLERTNARKVVSHTTRPPREGEVDGVKYHFTDVDAFQSLAIRDEFIEHAVVFGNLYGVHRDSLIKQLNDDSPVVHIVDIQGAITFKQLLPKHTVIVGIHPPSMAELRARLTKRGDTDPSVMETRLSYALGEIAGLNEHADFHVVNDDLEDAVTQTISIVTRTHPASPNWRASGGEESN
jgi:guanylate kinase